MSKRAYSPPKLSQFQAMVFSEMVWESSGEEEAFLRLRPFYLACRKQELTPLAVRLKFEGEQEYRDWQAVGPVLAPCSGGSGQDANHGWILLGYVPPAIRFEAQLMCRDTQGKHGVAVARNLVADENKTFELAYFKVPLSASYSADQSSNLRYEAQVAVKV
jgi:hypothetical protein